MIKGKKVVMNDKYYVSEKNKGKIFEVTSEPYSVCGTVVVKLKGLSGCYALDGLDEVKDENRYLRRGKRVDTGEWVIGYLSYPHCMKKGNESYYFYAKDSLGFYCRCVVAASTICQRTGYEGIYEKDIIRYDYEEYVIKWSDDLLRWEAISLETDVSVPLGELNPDYMVVIGNEIDNPELLV